MKINPTTQDYKQVQQIFYRWLKLNNLFPMWKYNVAQQNNLPRFTDRLQHASLDSRMVLFIDNSFVWSETCQNSGFWLIKDSQWDDFVRNNVYIHTKKEYR